MEIENKFEKVKEEVSLLTKINKDFKIQGSDSCIDNKIDTKENNRDIKIIYHNNSKIYQ